MDFRKLNEVTFKDAYPLPQIDETLEALAGAQMFSTLDLASGYWQVEVEEGDKEKTAFSTRDGHFEFNVMPFGLTNAPATFERLMECVLAGLTYEECLIYPDKVSAVLEFPVPTDLKQLRQFLGLSNYYRRFIKGYSSIAEPLHKLTSKSGEGYQWNQECQNAFVSLKQKLTTPPILAYPQFNHPFIVATDASGTAIGAVLSQDVEGEEKVIAYWSWQLNKAERNYSTIEREALAAVAAIKEFFPYLYGKQFMLLTDHNPLTSLRGLKDTGGRLTRWLLYLQQFDMLIRYRSGKNNANADGLSQRPSSEETIKASHIISASNIAEDDGLVLVNSITYLGDVEELKREQASDEFTANIIRTLKEGKQLSCELERWHKFMIINGVLCRQSRKSSTKPRTQIVVP